MAARAVDPVVSDERRPSLEGGGGGIGKLPLSRPFKLTATRASCPRVGAEWGAAPLAMLGWLWGGARVWTAALVVAVLWVGGERLAASETVACETDACETVRSCAGAVLPRPLITSAVWPSRSDVLPPR